MLGHCTACNQQSDLKISKKTKRVVCTICGGEPQVSPFVIRAMENNREYIEDHKKSFSFRCEECKEIEPALIENDRAVCTKCGKEIKSVSPFMINTMKMMGKIAKGKDE